MVCLLDCLRRGVCYLQSPVWLNLSVRRPDNAVRFGGVLAPEGLWQLWCMVLEARRRPLLKRRQRDLLRLRRAIGPRTRLRCVGRHPHRVSG